MDLKKNNLYSTVYEAFLTVLTRSYKGTNKPCACCSWFHGKISGPEAVSKLRPAEDGLFLVRESIRHPGDYVLCVSISGEVIHYRVIYQDSKLTIDRAQYFYNLIDMIEVRRQTRPDLCSCIANTFRKCDKFNMTTHWAKFVSNPMINFSVFFYVVVLFCFQKWETLLLLLPCLCSCCHLTSDLKH